MSERELVAIIGMTDTELVSIINDALSGVTNGEYRLAMPSPALYDQRIQVLCAGDLAFRLTPQFVRLLADTSGGGVAIDGVLTELNSIVRDTYGRAYSDGAASGREEIIKLTHRLLGIDRLVEALQELEPNQDGR